MGPVIVMLGAGSATFAISIITDILLSDGLQECVFRMVDIDEGRLAESKAAALSYKEETHSAIKIEAYTDRREALDGADFVICAVKIGGYGSLEAERKIAETHGYYRGIGDRVSCYFGGVGAYWQIRFLEEVTRDMEKLCPNALLVQTANPVFDGTNYITRHSRIKAVGVCHGHFQAYYIADILGLEREHVSFDVAGFNHHIYMTDFRYRGKDAYPILDKWIEEKSEEYWKSEEYNTPGRFGFAPEELTPGAVDAYKLYGLMPIGDAIRSASPWWHHVDFAEKVKWYGVNGGFDSEICWANYLSLKDTHHELIRSALNEGKLISSVYPVKASGEQHVPVINAIVTDCYERFTLSIVNNGCLPGIPGDIMVEIPAMVSAKGIFGIKMDPLPRRIMDNVMYPRLRTMNNLHEAYETGNRKLLVLELMQDPRTKSYEQAKSLIDDLLLQSWNADANAHYR